MLAKENLYPALADLGLSVHFAFSVGGFVVIYGAQISITVLASAAEKVRLKSHKTKPLRTVLARVRDRIARTHGSIRPTGKIFLEIMAWDSVCDLLHFCCTTA
jgi:hypothetical protein